MSRPAFLSLFIILSILQAHAQFKVAPPPIQRGPVMVDTCYFQSTNSTAHLAPTNKFLRKVGRKGGKMNKAEQSFLQSIQTAIFTVTSSGPAPDPSALQALQFAMDIWSTEVISGVPIRIEVAFASLAPGTLASTIVPSFFNVPNAPDPQIVYNAPLADAIAGFDVSPGEADFQIVFNNTVNYYYGTDGNTPPNQVDFVSTALHEIGHGLGMAGSNNAAGTEIGFNNGSNLRIYDLLAELGDGTSIVDLGFGTPAQANALRSEDLFMNSPSAVAFLGVRPKLYAPASYNAGSSYVHWDEATFPTGDPNGLMTPFADDGEAIHDIGNIFRGLLTDIGWDLVAEQPNIDGTAVSIDAPVTGKGLTNSELITISIGNLGTSPIRDFTVAYQLDANPPVAEFFGLEIAPGDVQQYTFNTPIDLSVEGQEYVIQAGVFIQGDERPGNDFTGAFVTNLPVIDNFPYFEDFEAGDGGWMVEPNSSWQLGVPSGNLIVSAASGTQAWVTNLDGEYAEDEASILVSPCLDFTSLAIDPVLTFALHTEIEFGFDGLAVQLTTDNGATWQNVGTLGDLNWYDTNLRSFGSTSLDFSGGNGDAFSGSSGGYRQVSHFLEGVAGEPSVQLRFVFGSDFSINGEGAAIDALSITAPTVNGSLVAIQNPTTGIDLTSAEEVVVTVANGGTQTIDNFQLAYSVNDGPAVIENFTGPLASGEVQDFTFQNTIDLSLPGSYEISVGINVLGDEIAEDNFLSSNVASFSAVSGELPYMESFENGPGGWFALGANSSWELGTPAGSTIMGASDGGNAWATNLNGLHNTEEQSFVVSPVFDFSSINQPAILLDVFYELGFFPASPPDFPNDVALNGAALQYSTDLGATWINVGEKGDPNNWYNANISSSELGLELAALEFSGGNGDSWSFSSGEYVTAIHDLSNLAGEPQVQLRIVLGTIPFDVFDTEGLAFDNIRIVDALQIACTDNPDPVENAEGTCSAEVVITTPSVTGSSDFELTNSYNGTEDATDEYPVGKTIVTWTARDLVTGLTATCSVEVVVEDVELPTINSENVFVIVDEGETSVVVEYDLPEIGDNCELSTLITHSTNLGLPFDGGALSCSSGQTSFIRLFGPQQEFSLAEEFVVTKGIFGINNAFDASGSQEVLLNIYAIQPGNNLLFENFTLLASEIVEVPNIDINDPTQYRLFEVPINATIPKGQYAVMEILSAPLGESEGGRDIGVASNTAGQSAESYVVAPACGVLEPTPVSAIPLPPGFPEVSYVMGLESDITAPLYLVEGIGSGSAFPLGTTTETYAVVDRAGNVAFTSFDVTVEEEQPAFPLQLVEAPSGHVIRELINGDVIDVMDPATRNVSIIAALDEFDEQVESVVFELNGQIERIENQVPYAIAGDKRGFIKEFTFTLGINILTVTPYSEDRGEGTALESVTVTFEVINSSSVTSLTIIDAQTDLPVGPLIEGGVIDLADTPEVSIEATTDPEQVGSVVFELNGERLRPESFPPYALGGDEHGNYYPFEFEAGSQTLTATPFERKGGQGTTGTPLTINFEVVYGAEIAQVEVLNTKTSEVIGNLTDGSIIDLANPAMGQITLVARTTPEEVGSVEFILDGHRVKTENAVPYAIAGDKRGDEYHPFDFEPGTHKLTIKTYSGEGRSGIEGGSITINFDVVYGARIDQLNIVDTKTNDVLGALDGAVINTKDHAYKYITVVAETLPDEVGSVEFILDGKRVRIEDDSPYAIAGSSKGGKKKGGKKKGGKDNDPKLKKKKFKKGFHELTVIPYSEKKGKGLAGEAMTVTFEVISEKYQKREEVVPTTEEENEPIEEISEAISEELTVYPVPFTTSLQFALMSSNSDKLEIKILDLSGKTLIGKSFDVQQGMNQLSLELISANIPSGTYLVSVSGESFGRKLVRVIKK